MINLTTMRCLRIKQPEIDQKPRNVDRDKESHFCNLSKSAVEEMKSAYLYL